MLSGPAILRISVLLLVAGALAALVQFLLPPAPPAPVAEPPAAAGPAEPEPPPVPPAAVSPAPAPEQPAPQPRAGPAAIPTDALLFPPAAPPRPAVPPTAAAPPTPAPPQAPAPRGEAEIARAEESAGPRAVALADLNTASVADLNRLQGGGAIGRAIVAKRPYASVDQLLSKRVLSRAIYDRIKGQVTVR